MQSLPCSACCTNQPDFGVKAMSSPSAPWPRIQAPYMPQQEETLVTSWGRRWMTELAHPAITDLKDQRCWPHLPMRVPALRAALTRALILLKQNMVHSWLLVPQKRAASIRIARTAARMAAAGATKAGLGRRSTHLRCPCRASTITSVARCHSKQTQPHRLHTLPRPRHGD